MSRATFPHIALVVTAVLFLALAAVLPHWGILCIAVALALMLLVATSASVAGRLAKSLDPFLDRPVEILIWGESVPGPCRIQSARALGPGLHLFVNCAGERRPTHIKIAQPKFATIAEESFEIGDAKYVQCAGKTMPRTAEVPAVCIKGSTASRQ